MQTVYILKAHSIKEWAFVRCFFIALPLDRQSKGNSTMFHHRFSIIVWYNYKHLTNLYFRVLLRKMLYPSRYFLITFVNCFCHLAFRKLNAIISKDFVNMPYNAVIAIIDSVICVPVLCSPKGCLFTILTAESHINRILRLIAIPLAVKLDYVPSVRYKTYTCDIIARNSKERTQVLKSFTMFVTSASS